MSDETIDLTRGIYRRIYANFIVGRRINSVSLEAEAWFWRIISVADDFGNLTGDTSLIYVATVGRRVSSVTLTQVESWTTELIEIGLLDRYEVGADAFMHVRGYLGSQAAGINGKRVRRVPAWPHEDKERLKGVADDAARARANPGESKKPRVKPSGNYEPEPELRTTTKVVVVQASASPAPAPPSEVTTTTTGREQEGPANPMEGSLVDVPCTDRFFPVVQSLVDRLQVEFPDLYVLGDIYALASYLRRDPSKQQPLGKAFDGIRRWLTHAMRNPELRAKRASIAASVTAQPVRETAMDRRRRELDAALK